MVENLVKDHIQDLDTLILIAMPMTGTFSIGSY